MNTKSIPACLALTAGFMTCVISFIQQTDIVVFAKRFVIASLVFFILGVIVSVVINMNFKDMAEDVEEGTLEEGESEEGSFEENHEYEEAE